MVVACAAPRPANRTALPHLTCAARYRVPRHGSLVLLAPRSPALLAPHSRVLLAPRSLVLLGRPQEREGRYAAPRHHEARSPRR